MRDSEISGTGARVRGWWEGAWYSGEMAGVSGDARVPSGEARLSESGYTGLEDLQDKGGGVGRTINLPLQVLGELLNWTA